MRNRTPHPPSSMPSRRGLLRGALALGAVGAGSAALSGCDNTVAQAFTGAAPGPSRLNFWNPFGGGDGVRMIAMEDAYRKQRPRTSLKAATFGWGTPYYTKLTLATLGGRPPQVAVAHLSKVPMLAEAGLLSALRPQDLAQHGMTQGKFSPTAWKKAHLEGELYAIPLDTHLFVLYSHTAVLQKAGLLDARGKMVSLDGPDAFINALKAAKEVTGAWGGSISSVKDPSTQFRLFWSLYRQVGGVDLVTDAGKKVVIDMAAAEQALAYIRRLTAEKLLPPSADGAAAITLFTSGKAGFLLDGVWQVLAVKDTSDVKFDMQRLPRVFKEAPYACFADSHALVLPKAPSAEAQRLDLSLEFASSLLGSSQLWAEGGHVPAWLPVQESAAYKSLVPQSHYADAAEGAVYDPAAWYGGAGSTLQNKVGDTVASVLSGARSPKAGAVKMRSELRRLAAIPSPL